MRILLFLLILSILPVVAIAQPASTAQMAGVKPEAAFGTMHFQTRLGSFKVINGRGRVEFDFKGTVMISDLKGKFDVSGRVRKEYDRQGRVIYTGTGHMVVTGEWRGIQWYGKDLKAVWYGAGVLRLSGEFDKEQKTGEFWYGDPNKINYWPGSNTSDVPNPEVRPGYNPGVTIKKKG